MSADRARPAADPGPPVPSSPAPAAPRRVLIDEAPLPRRVRRPGDLLRAVLGCATIVLVVLVGSIAVGTATGLEQDLVGVARGAPRLLLQLANVVASAGLLALPLLAALDLVIRRRAGQILDSIVGAAVCVLITSLLTIWITTVEPAQILETLTKVLPDGTRSQAINHVLAAVVAFLLVTDLRGRPRLRTGGIVTIGAVLLSSVLAGQVTLLALVVSLLIGWTVGIATRWAFGSFSTRPDGASVATALNAGGLGVVALAEAHDTSPDHRGYRATAEGGRRYDVVVLDRDQEGAGLVSLLWRRLRLIGPAARTRSVAVRPTLEHDALVSYAVAAAGVATPRLALASEVGDEAALLAYEQPRGRPLSALEEDEFTDDVLAAVWEQHRRMLRARIAHRALTRERILVREDGTVELLDLRYSQIAASDLQLRLDTTELLVSLALSIGSERAVRSGVEHLGADEIASALPLLQPVALTETSRRAVHDARGLLRQIRLDVVAATPSPATDPVQLQRISFKTLISVVGLTIAAYFLLTQLGQVNLGSLFASVDWTWTAIAAVLSVLTYIGATLSFVGFVPERLPFLRTLSAQVAASFVNLMAPSSLGGAALNARYLERSGIEPALAIATVGVAQVAAFTIHLTMLLLFGVLAGSARETDVTPSQDAVIAVIVVAALAAAFLLLPIGRRTLRQRIRPMLGRVLPRLIAVLQQPRRVATGLSGNLLLNLSYVFCMVACVRAFGSDASVLAIGLVYLAGSAVGSIVPTPGGIGAMEAALAAGLGAAGVEAGVAVSAVLLFRIVTFWIPILPGWLAFHDLERRGLL